MPYGQNPFSTTDSTTPAGKQAQTKVDANGNLQVNTDSGKVTFNNVSAASVLKLGPGTLERLNNLSSTNLGQLSTTQVAALTVGTIYDLSTTAVATLSTTQVSSLSSGTVAALSTTQVSALSSTNLLAVATVTLPTIDFSGTGYTNALVFNPASTGQNATIVAK